MTAHGNGSSPDERSSSLAGLNPVYRNICVVLFTLLFLLPLLITVPFILSDPENPDGMIEFPDDVEMRSDGFLLVILDGVGREQLLDKSQYSGLHSVMTSPAVLEVETGPLTLSATCISELMTGVPNSPIDGLKNFDLGHPGGEDPWTLAQDDPRFSVGFIGSYVIGNLYESHRHIEFVNTFKGHGDFYEGDIDTERELQAWFTEERHNVITAHFSGPDKVGHKWGVQSDEYRDKMLDMDTMLVRVLESVPSTWTVIVTADHGMTDSGSHGSAEAITREVAALISGPDIIQSATGEVHQRDLPALMSSVLGLPLPVQLHGQAPLDILIVTPEKKEILEQWNWEAAIARDKFYADENGFSDGRLDATTIEWEEIKSDATFSRAIDHYLALAAWAAVVGLSLVLVGQRLIQSPQDRLNASLFIGIIGFSLWSHIQLSDHPMVPRFAGGALASALVAWPFLHPNSPHLPQLQAPEHHSKPSFSGFSNHKFWFILFVILWALTQDFSTSVGYLTIVWFIALGAEMIGITQAPLVQERSPLVPALLCVGGLMFASLRLWFCLIPLFLILSREVHSAWKSKVSKPLLLSLFSMAFMAFLALIAVHRRVFGRHVLLDFVRFGWPTTIATWVFSIVVLVAACLIATYVIQKNFNAKAGSISLVWLMGGLFVQTAGSTAIDLVYLAASLGGVLWLHYGSKWQSQPLLSKQMKMTVLSGYLLLTWGAWAGATTFVLLATLGQVAELLLDRFDMDEALLNNPRMFMALAMLPWAVWILWWASLGQINGLQTCMEGICPHPRELDPGAVMVRGGYVGSRENPSTSWMTMMSVAPLFFTSIAIFMRFRTLKLPLYPFICGQLILIFGCVNMFAFSAEYPRLVFTLTWSILFSSFQILTASIAWALTSRIIPWAKQSFLAIGSTPEEEDDKHAVRFLI